MAFVPVALAQSVSALLDKRTGSTRSAQGGFKEIGLAPTFRLEVNDIPINVDITQFVQSVEFESSLEIADLMRIVVDNPGLVDDSFPDWSLHKAFLQGNEASLFIGFGAADRPDNFVGRVQWAKHLPVYPREGMPQLEVKGYDLRHKMMDVSGPIITSGTLKKVRLTKTRPTDQADNQGQVFANIRHSDVVASLADQHGLDKDIDHTTRPESVVLKKGMKHYEIVKGLANLNNREFWVDYDIKKRKWVLHWKTLNRDQRPGFVFRYNNGDGSTLLEAEPEYGLRETINEATILIFDGKNQRWVSAIEIKDAAGPNPDFQQGGGLMEKGTPTASSRKRISKKRPKSEAKAKLGKKQRQNVIDEAYDNAAQFRIAASGFAIDVIAPGRRFKTVKDAAEWLFMWFRKKQDNFITVNGLVIGVESLRARQVHTLKGLGAAFDGEYFFTRVRHVLQPGQNYLCEFTANKVIKG